MLVKQGLKTLFIFLCRGKEYYRAIFFCYFLEGLKIPKEEEADKTE